MAIRQPDPAAVPTAIRSGAQARAPGRGRRRSRTRATRRRRWTRSRPPPASPSSSCTATSAPRRRSTAPCSSRSSTARSSCSSPNVAPGPPGRRHRPARCSASPASGPTASGCCGATRPASRSSPTTRCRSATSPSSAAREVVSAARRARRSRSGPRRRCSTISSTRCSTGSTTATAAHDDDVRRARDRRAPGNRRGVGRRICDCVPGRAGLDAGSTGVRRRGRWRDAQADAGVDVGELIGRHHRPQRRDRDLELIEVGLAGRELLQQQARAASAPAPTALCMLLRRRAGSPRS